MTGAEERRAEYPGKKTTASSEMYAFYTLDTCQGLGLDSGRADVGKVLIVPCQILLSVCAADFRTVDVDAHSRHSRHCESQVGISCLCNLLSRLPCVTYDRKEFLRLKLEVIVSRFSRCVVSYWSMLV